MHIFGKICLWISVLCILVAMWLTAKLYTARAGYIKQKVELEAKMDRNAAEIDDLSNKVRETKRELTSELQQWSPYWNDVQVDVRQDNSVAINIGEQHGLDVASENRDAGKQNLVYCFQPNDDGTFSYLGDFRVVSLEPNQALLAPNWELLPGEADSWDAAKKWRVRALVPSQYHARFNGLELQINTQSELLASKLEDKAEQNQLLTMAQERLDQRIAEIDGPQQPVSDADKRPREDAVGLLTALEEAEEVRNAIIKMSDDRRRILLQTTEDFERVQAENLRVVESLPQGETDGAAEAATQPATVNR